MNDYYVLMEPKNSPLNRDEFKHIIEFEINRLDVITGSLQTNITQIKLAFIGSFFAVVLALNIFIKNTYNLIDILISISFFIASILFIISTISLIKSTIMRKDIGKPNVKNIPYDAVLKTNIDDRKIYLANFFEPILKIYLSMQIFFIISMISPYIWQSLDLSIWHKSIQWVSYFIILDVILLSNFNLFYKEKESTDFLFDRESIISKLNNIKSVKKSKLIYPIALIIFILAYPYFWFILTSQYILSNINYLFLKFNELPFVYMVVFITTWFFINLNDEYVNQKYHTKVLVLKQEKHRDIRRELYESEKPDLEILWSEFKLNAPW